MEAVKTRAERFRLLNAIKESEDSPDIGYMMDTKEFVRALRICATVLRTKAFEAAEQTIQLTLPYFQPDKPVRFEGTVTVSVVTPVVSVSIPVKCTYTESRGGFVFFPVKLVSLISAWKTSKIHLKRMEGTPYMLIVGGNKLCKFVPPQYAVEQKDIAPLTFRTLTLYDSPATQLAAMASFSDKDDSRRVLKTVHIVFNDDASGYMMEATNGKALIRRTTPGIKCAEALHSDNSFLINADVCKLLPRIFGTSSFALGVGKAGKRSEKRLQFISDKGSVTLWDNDSQYPNMQQVIPGPRAGVALIPAFSLLWAASELLTYKDLSPIRMEMDGNAKMTLWTRLMDGSEFNVVIPCDPSIKGDKCTWNLPSSEFFRLFRLTGDIRVEFSDSHSPVVFITDTDLCVIMPTRVN